MLHPGEDLILVTDFNSPNKRIVKTSFTNPSQNNWKDLIAETEFVLSPSVCGGYIFTEYMVDAISKVYQYTYNGKLVREVNLPGIGSASGFSGEKDQMDLYFSFSNYYTPMSRFKLNVKSGKYDPESCNIFLH